MRVLMAAGGTGGHLIPAVRIAEAVKRQRGNAEFLFVGGDRGLEEKVIVGRGYRYVGLPARGFLRTRIWRNVGALWDDLRANRLARRTVTDYAPQIAVGCAGYASYFPIRAARSLKIPYVLQEQNLLPGLVTRWLSARAETVFIAFEQTRARLPRARSIDLVGNPIDPRLATLARTDARKRWGLTEEEKVIVVTGGSGGARSINQSIVSGLKEPCSHPPVTILWQTGRHGVQWDRKPATGWTVHDFEFTDAMTEAFVAADLIVARAGALTISEIAAAGRPAILVPFPYATADHQTHNARVLAEAGGALIFDDSQLSAISLLDIAVDLLKDDRRLVEMRRANRALGRPDAADRIATRVISLAEGTGLGEH
jgi:UDP-N-acetylglucosamine--N-acetylmuramyl-(pentapeptide) pyrophosphoryl-undecaprenol N-acetylglucosamine transferase